MWAEQPYKNYVQESMLYPATKGTQVLENHAQVNTLNLGMWAEQPYNNYIEESMVYYFKE